MDRLSGKSRHKPEMLKFLTCYINDNFGSRRGLFNALKYKFLFLIGYYRSYQHINFNTVNRLVFICSGNICRSPYGEYMAKAAGLNSVSYGLRCRGGDKADPRALHQASLSGVSIQSHITTNISEYKLRKGDLFLVMEPRHLLELNASNVEYDQVTIAPLWSNKPTPYLHDPFNTNDVFFSRCELVVEQCVSNIQIRMTTGKIPV
jgi:protein-tyrosine phosphatase